MTPHQLLLRGPEREHASLDLVDNRTGAPPLSFEDIPHNVRVPRFGGGALIQAAARALEGGYQVRKFELIGPDRAQIPDGEAEREISSDLVDALQHHGAHRVQGMLRHEYRSYLLCGIQVYSPTTRTITLRRNGVVEGKTDSQLWGFIHGVLESSDDE